MTGNTQTNKLPTTFTSIILQSPVFNTIHRIFSTSRPFHVIGSETRMFWIFLPVLLLFSIGGKLHASKSQQLAYHLQHPQEQFCSADFGKCCSNFDQNCLLICYIHSPRELFSLYQILDGKVKGSFHGINWGIIRLEMTRTSACTEDQRISNTTC